MAAVHPPREGADAYLIRATLLVPTDSVASRSDFALPKGVLVQGRVIEAGTGKPVVGAVVTHQAHQRNNPYFVKGSADYLNGNEQYAVSDADGAYRLAVMPGPGYLLAKGPTSDYLHEEIPNVELHGQLIWPNERNYPDAFRKLGPKPDEGPLDVDLTLRPGSKVGGSVVGVDGKPAQSVVMFGRSYLIPSRMSLRSPSTRPTRGGRFELGGLNPDSASTVFFLDVDRQQGAVVELSGKPAGGDVEVRLQPCGSATLRFVDSEGKPIPPGRLPAQPEVVLTPGVSFGDSFRAMKDDKSPLMADALYVTNLDRERYRDLKVDAEGRVTFPTLIPGATYRIGALNQPVKSEVEFTVKPGETRDLGDLKILNIGQ